eukprot:365303-Chlamydomonas_euryale.AAC.23
MPYLLHFYNSDIYENSRCVHSDLEQELSSASFTTDIPTATMLMWKLQRCKKQTESVGEEHFGMDAAQKGLSTCRDRYPCSCAWEQDAIRSGLEPWAHASEQSQPLLTHLAALECCGLVCEQLVIDAVGAAITAEGVPNGATAAAAAGAPNSADADSMFAPPVLVPAALPAGRPKIVLELAALLPTPAPHVTPPATGAAAGCPNTLAGP